LQLQVAPQGRATFYFQPNVKTAICWAKLKKEQDISTKRMEGHVCPMIQGVWDVTPCHWANISKRFE